MSVQVDVVIVNWNAGLLLRDCVESIVAADRAGDLVSLAIVDNGSSDHSSTGLPAGQVRSTVIQNLSNRGFAAACNQGAGVGCAPYILFLNPDTRVDRAALSRVLAFMDDAANVSIGICGIQLVDDAGHVSRSCSRHPSPGRMLGGLAALDRVMPSVVAPHLMSEWDHAENRLVDQVIGAFFFVRRSLFERLGGFDERFFVYYEEVDFARRADSLGMRTYFLADTQAYHAGGGTTNSVRAFRQFLVTQSRTLYAFKHFSRLTATLHAVGALTVEPLVRVAYFLLRGDLRSARESVVAARRLWSGASFLLHGEETPGTRPLAGPVK